MIITDKLISYYWGLEGRPYNTKTRCPIGIYVSPRTKQPGAVNSSPGPYFQLATATGFDPDIGNFNIDKTYIVNKVRVYFQVTS